MKQGFFCFPRGRNIRVVLDRCHGLEFGEEQMKCKKLADIVMADLAEPMPALKEPRNKPSTKWLVLN